MNFDWGLIGYVAACVAAPALWGGLCAVLFGHLDARRKLRGERARERTYVDYSI